MNPHAGRPGLPPPAADATRQIADRLTDALGPYMMSDDPAAEVRILWHAAKLLSAVAGGWEMDSVPAADRAYVQWSDVAEIASDIADAALGIAAEGMTGAQAAEQVNVAEVAAASTTAAVAATPVGVLQVAHHLRRLGTVLAGSVIEPWEAGLPLGGRPAHDVTCEICGRAVSADIARTVEVTKTWRRKVTVCSVICARAAHAGEHAG